MNIEIYINDEIEESEVIDLYRANKWSAAEKPAELLPALRNSHTLVTARANGKLIGIANALSDGHLVVYYPHMLVHPDYQRMGVGRKMMESMQNRYAGFHQQSLTAYGEAVDFYKSLGFVRAGKAEPMCMFLGNDL